MQDPFFENKPLYSKLINFNEYDNIKSNLDEINDRKYYFVNMYSLIIL